MLLETGCTNGEKPNIYNDQQEVKTNNTVKKEKNEQYVHNGKGTTIISNKEIKMQPTRQEFNNEKIEKSPG